MAKVEKILDSEVTKKFVCTIEKEELEAKVEKELVKLQETVELKGFRKGHAPLKMVEGLYRKQVYSDALSGILNDESVKIVKEGDLKLAAHPKITAKEGEELVFEMQYELMPNMSGFDFSSIEVPSYEIELTEGELQKELNAIAEKNRDYKVVDGVAAESGDIALIDTVGSIDGVEFEGGKVENYDLLLGSGSFIPGFEEQLIGAKAGDMIEVNVAFPAEYHVKDLASKPAKFLTKVKAIKKGETPAIDDNLAKKHSAETVEDLKNDVKKRIESFYKNAYMDSIKGKVFDELAKKLSFAVSDGLLERVLDSVVEEKKKAGAEGSDEELRVQNMEEARRRLRLSFFLNHIADEQKLVVSEQDFINFIVQNASKTGMNPFQFLEFYNKNREAKKALEALIQENKIYEYIFSQINCKNEKVSKEKFDEILKAK